MISRVAPQPYRPRNRDTQSSRARSDHLPIIVVLIVIRLLDDGCHLA
jgi:hypothetical protein